MNLDFGLLTQRELEILETVITYYPHKVAAAHLGISYPTIKGHLTRIRERLGEHESPPLIQVLIAYDRWKRSGTWPERERRSPYDRRQRERRSGVDRRTS